MLNDRSLKIVTQMARFSIAFDSNKRLNLPKTAAGGVAGYGGA
jgi:hypothetical protein